MNLQKDATSKPRPQLVAPISQQKSSKSKFAYIDRSVITLLHYEISRRRKINDLLIYDSDDAYY